MIAIILFLESLGGGELMVIMLFVLLFFGSKKIPDLARGLGKGMREFKTAMNGVQDEIKQGMKVAESEVDKVKAELPPMPIIESHPLAQPVNDSLSKQLGSEINTENTPTKL
jgi:sec-independent protein translocase protein TatA